MEVKNICEQVGAIALNVGEFIRNERAGFNLEKVKDKGLNQLVSYVDVTAENKLVEELKKVLPEAGFITEEETKDDTTKEYKWIIDPLDGTTNFIHGLPCYSISIALMKGDEVIVGVVYEINRNENFYAWKGGGAYMNGQPIQTSNATSLKDSLLATGFPYYDFGQMQDYLKVLEILMQRTHGLRRFGSAAVDLAYTACGRFEGFFEYGLSPWDVAAGTLIVQEAGGKVTDFSGNNDYIFGKEIVAGTTGMYDEFLGVIKGEFKK